MATFTFTPLYSFQRSIGRRVRITDFESGKEQRADLGPEPREWSLHFGGTPAQMKPIEDFYTAQSGPFLSFSWIPPNMATAVTVRFKDTLSISQSGTNAVMIDCTFREVL